MERNSNFLIGVLFGLGISALIYWFGIRNKNKNKVN